MSKREKDRVREVLSAPGVKLWDRYKARVEEIRADLLGGGKTEPEASAAWADALTEDPFNAAMLGKPSSLQITVPGIESDPENRINPDTILQPHAAPPPEDVDCTDGPSSEQTPRADMLWVGANIGVQGVIRMDAPNQTCWNLLQWAIDPRNDYENTKTFWTKHMSIATSREGEKQDRMKDDGQPALLTVEALLDSDYGGAEMAA